MEPYQKHVIYLFKYTLRLEVFDHFKNVVSSFIEEHRFFFVFRYGVFLNYQFFNLHFLLEDLTNLHV